MALVVETGSGVANANSYVTLAEARAYAADRGVTLPADITLTAQLIKATDYLETFALQFVGTPTNATQALQWPRSGVVFGETEFPDDTIPTALKQAQIRLAMEQVAGVDIMPTVTGKFVKRRKVGPIETEYSERVNADGRPSMPVVEALLSSLLSVAKGFTLTTIRV